MNANDVELELRSTTDFFFEILKGTTAESERKQILSFIITHISEDDMRFNDSEFSKIEDIDDIYRTNAEIIHDLELPMVKWLIQLIELINNNFIHNMDKDNMAVFQSSGFCWDMRGNFVIFNEK